jgi:hypothetical protein
MQRGTYRPIVMGCRSNAWTLPVMKTLAGDVLTRQASEG